MFELIRDIVGEYGGVTNGDSEVWAVQLPSQEDADDVVEFVNSLAASRGNWYAHRHCSIASLIMIHPGV